MSNHIFADEWQNMRPAMHVAAGLGLGCVNAIMIVLIDGVRMHMGGFHIELMRMRKLRASQYKGQSGNELNQSFR